MDMSFPWNSLETLLFALKGGASMLFMPSLTVNEVPETVFNALNKKRRGGNLPNPY